jgi:hypothetical protein
VIADAVAMLKVGVADAVEVLEIGVPVLEIGVAVLETGVEVEVRADRVTLLACGGRVHVKETEDETEDRGAGYQRVLRQCVAPGQSWRRMRDSNSRGVATNTLSKRAP